MNPPNGQTPLDYLNQITPQAPKKPLFALNLRTIIFGGVLLVILVIIIAIISGSIAQSRKTPWEHLSARLDSTLELVDGAGKNIKNGQLRSLNSEVKLFVTNTQRDLATYLKKQDIDPKKLPASVLASESSEGIGGKLEDGRLNARYDTTYSREMGYLLATILALLKELYSGTNNTSTKEFLESTFNNLQPTQKAIEGFSSTTE